MVQKYQCPLLVYKYPFELVMRAYEMRFPTCDMIPIVHETEVVEEVLDDATGVHIIDRRAKVTHSGRPLLVRLKTTPHKISYVKNHNTQTSNIIRKKTKEIELKKI